MLDVCDPPGSGEEVTTAPRAQGQDRRPAARGSQAWGGGTRPGWGCLLRARCRAESWLGWRSSLRGGLVIILENHFLGSTFEVEFVTHSSCEGHCYTPDNTSCVEESGMFCFTGFCYSVLVSHRQAGLPLQDATRARRRQPAAGLVPLQLFPLDKDIGT